MSEAKVREVGRRNPRVPGREGAPEAGGHELIGSGLRTTGFGSCFFLHSHPHRVPPSTPLKVLQTQPSCLLTGSGPSFSAPSRSSCTTSIHFHPPSLATSVPAHCSALPHQSVPKSPLPNLSTGYQSEHSCNVKPKVTFLPSFCG